MAAGATGEDAERDLETFLAEYEPGIQQTARAVRARLQDLVPGAVELVYDNYAGLVIGFGASERPSEAVLSIAVRPKWVTLCFLWGVDLPDPDGLLQGSGNQVRSIRLAGPEDLEVPAIRKLIAEAVKRSAAPFDPGAPRRTVVRSISARQQPRRPKKNA